MEYSQLFGKYTHLRASLLERMPPMELLRQNDNKTNGDIDEEPRSEEPSPQHNTIKNESVIILIHFSV